jgi:serine protease DegQ
MYRLWIIFAQAATVAVAVVFVVSTFHPEWLPARGTAQTAAPAAAPLVVQAPTAGPLPSAVSGGSYYEAVKRATPSVVNVFSSKEVSTSRHPLLDDPMFRRFFSDGMQQRRSSLGSGVIVSANGYVLTNHHVVEAADEIEVALADGTKLLAKVVGNDPETDLAVLRVDADNLPAITFGSSEALRVGDVVLAIGNPFGVGQTVTGGIVSALGRRGLGINTFENFIQTDAAINPGNSGGALVDAGGNLVGINTAIFTTRTTGGNMGIGFATPVSTAKSVLEQIVRTGAVTRGWIGVELREMTPAIAEAFKLDTLRGALVGGVLRGGPAEKAGIQAGDVVVEVAGRPVIDNPTLVNSVAALAPGTSARVKVKRKGRDVDASIVIGRRPKPQPRPE